MKSVTVSPCSITVQPSHRFIYHLLSYGSHVSSKAMQHCHMHLICKSMTRTRRNDRLIVGVELESGRGRHAWYASSWFLVSMHDIASPANLWGEDGTWRGWRWKINARVITDFDSSWRKGVWSRLRFVSKLLIWPRKEKIRKIVKMRSLFWVNISKNRLTGVFHQKFLDLLLRNYDC